MAITIDWGSKVISVPKADTQLVQTNPVEIRQLDLDTFRLALNNLQDGEQGITYETTNRHVAPITVGGVTLARVVEIINGYTVTFENGTYAVNLVGANSNVGDVTNLNNVSIRSSNSAGLTFSEQVNDQSFTNGNVYLNAAQGKSGTQFPRGTPTDPVNNLTDAIAIANSRSLEGIMLTGFVTADGTHNLDGITVKGGSGASNVVYLNGASTVNSGFERLIVCGAQGGLSRFVDVILGVTGLAGFTEAEGRFSDCIINTPAGFVQKTTGVGSLLDNCTFVCPNNPQVTFDANGKAYSMRSCNGNILVTNSTDTESKEVHLTGGRIEFGASCNAGSIYIYGGSEVVDNSSVGFTVVNRSTIINLDVINQGVQKASLLVPHTQDINT